MVGTHEKFPIQKLALSCDGNVCASISHDELVKFWNVKNIKEIKLDAGSKSKSKSAKNKKLNAGGKSENFFSDIIEEKDDDDDDDDDGDSDDSDDDSDDE